jgi:hypothetical protein
MVKMAEVEASGLRRYRERPVAHVRDGVDVDSRHQPILIFLIWFFSLYMRSVAGMHNFFAAGFTPSRT